MKMKMKKGMMKFSVHSSSVGSVEHPFFPSSGSHQHTQNFISNSRPCPRCAAPRITLAAHSRTTVTIAIMATNGDYSDEDAHSQPDSPVLDSFGNNPEHDDFDHDDSDEHEDIGQEEVIEKPLKSALKKGGSMLPPPSAVQVQRPVLPEQPSPETLDLSQLTPLSPEIIARQATINIGTIGHVAHGKSTVVKAISEVQTVRFKNELERNITIKLGYANAKIYKCDSPECPRPTCFKSYKSEKEIDPPCERDGCSGRYRLLRHVS